MVSILKHLSTNTGKGRIFGYGLDDPHIDISRLALLHVEYVQDPFLNISSVQILKLNRAVIISLILSSSP